MSAPQDFSDLLNEIAFLKVQQEQQTKRREAESAFSDAIANATLTGLEGQARVGETAAKQKLKQEQERTKASTQGKPPPQVGGTFPVGPVSPGAPERSFLQTAAQFAPIQGAAGGAAVQQFANQRPQGAPQAAAAAGAPGAGAPGVTTTTRGQIARSFGTGTSLIPTTQTQTQTGISQAQLGQLQIQQQAQRRLRAQSVVAQSADLMKTFKIGGGDAIRASVAAAGGDLVSYHAILKDKGLRSEERDKVLLDMHRAATNASIAQTARTRIQTEVDIVELKKNMTSLGILGAAGIGGIPDKIIGQIKDDLKAQLTETGDIAPGQEGGFQGSQLQLLAQGLVLSHNAKSGIPALGFGERGKTKMLPLKDVLNAMSTLRGEFQITPLKPDGTPKTGAEIRGESQKLKGLAQELLESTGLTEEGVNDVLAGAINNIADQRSTYWQKTGDHVVYGVDIDRRILEELRSREAPTIGGAGEVVGGFVFGAGIALAKSGNIYQRYNELAARTIAGAAEFGLGFSRGFAEGFGEARREGE